MTNMLPAEKTHYRKGLALGMTLAEIFCVVVFVLLLACAVLLVSQGAKLTDARADLAARGKTAWRETRMESRSGGRQAEWGRRKCGNWA